MASPAETRPLEGGRRIFTAIALALGTFMMVLDSTIANVSLPTIAGNLGVSSSNSTWIITSFAVANGISMPLTGWVMRRFGVVKTFCVSLALFTFASFLCGVAWSLPSLVAFRVLQGVVAGPMMPGSQALLISIYPPNKRSVALGIWSITTLVAPIMGPILGGYISDNYHWSWIFLLNVPIGIFAAIACWVSLADRETPTMKMPIDTIGLILLVVWVGALQIMLDLGEDADWFHDRTIVVLGLVSALSFVVWLIWELTDRSPMVDLRLFRDRNFLIGTIAFCLAYAIFFANILLVPLWMQTQLGYTATWAGLAMAPSGLIALLLTPVATWAANRIDLRWIATVAMGAFVVSYWLRSQFVVGAGFWDYTLPISIQGISMATFFVSMVAISIDRIPQDMIPSATGLQNFARMVMGGIAASLVTTYWNRREALYQSRMSETAGTGAPLQEVSDMLQRLGLDAQQSVAVITREMVRQAYMLSANDLFWLSAWLAAAMTGIIWFTRRTATH